MNDTDTARIIALVFEELPAEQEPAPDFSRLIADKAARQQASPRAVSNIMGAAIALATRGQTIKLKGRIS